MQDNLRIPYGNLWAAFCDPFFPIDEKVRNHHRNRSKKAGKNLQPFDIGTSARLAGWLAGWLASLISQAIYDGIS
jgi:hypothetical protein